MAEKQEKLRAAGMLASGFEFRGVKFRPLSLATLSALEIVDSPFFNGDGGRIKGVIDYMLAHSAPRDEVLALCCDKAAWDKAAWDIGEKFHDDDLAELVKLIEGDGAEVAATVAEVSEQAAKKP